MTRESWIVSWLDAAAAKDEDRDLADFACERTALNRGHAESVGRKLLKQGKVCGSSVEIKRVRYFRDEDGVPDETILESHEVRL
ncbi:MAG: hypothetical protein KF889_25565 [Alphaproteobacteria bacterium]|nr:hypothetical protein [Alphaproteobacteria bacterium]MCW5739636.1 hypothetical protein [Alphaproteobacteria bacterium]